MGDLNSREYALHGPQPLPTPVDSPIFPAGEYKRFRPDGWPFCPQCDEDELYSLAIPASVETICGCYRCGPWPIVDPFAPRADTRREEP